MKTRRFRRSVLKLGVVLALLLALSACAPGPNAMAGAPREGEEIAGFWDGLWHGLIAPVTFIISLFNDNVAVYEVHNSGGWYNFGFLFGMMMVFGGGGGGAASSRRRSV